MVFDVEKNEAMKDLARSVLSSDAVLGDKVNAAIDLIKAYHERAVVENRKRFESVSFEDYAALLLKACYENIFKPYGDEVYNSLVEMYGLKDGLAEGKTYTMADEV